MLPMATLKQKALFAIFLAASCTPAYAQNQTTVNMDSGGLFLFNEGATKLTGGTTLDGDGAVIQLGYYNAATASNNFAGNWVALTGEMSLNTKTIPSSNDSEPFNKTSIGDLTSQGGVVGEFWLPALTFVQGSANSGNNLPASSTIPLAIRFYNNTTIATSTFYNVVSDDAWLWQTPVAPQSDTGVNISLSQGGLEWLSTAMGQPTTNEFHTSIGLQAVPEPTTVAAGTLCAASLIYGALRGRRRKA
jgi:hypothetical protein